MSSFLARIVRSVLVEDIAAKTINYLVRPVGREGLTGDTGEAEGGGAAISYPFRLSSSGLARLMKHEGNVLHVYDDRVMGSQPTSYSDVRGFPTIGMGILINTDEEKKLFAPYLNGVDAPASLIDSENKKKIASFEGTLNGKLGRDARMTQSMYDALFSMYWNTGSARQAIAAVRKGDYAGAQAAIANGPTTSKGEVVQGLVARRKAEAELFGAEGLGVGGVDSSGSSPEDEAGWREKVVAAARGEIGRPYLWGGESPAGFDCSGLVWYVLRGSGLTPSLTRDVSGKQLAMGTPISQSDLRPGDLVGFSSGSGEIVHIGIYTGGTKYISALGGGRETTLTNPTRFSDGTTARVMEADFTRDSRRKSFASISRLIEKRLKAGEKDKDLVASAENGQEKKKA